MIHGCEVHHTTCMIYAMRYRTPDPGNPRVQSTRDRILAAARELLAETGPAGLTYSLLADRAGVTRQTLYRHWPALGPSRGAVVLFHRGHEHGGRMAHLADELDVPDLDVFAWDARGHGRSPG